MTWNTKLAGSGNQHLPTDNDNTPDQRQAARLLVANRATSTADLRDLLEVLGLLDEEVLPA